MMRVTKNVRIFILITLSSIVLGRAQTASSAPSQVNGVYQIGTLAELLWVAENSSSWTSTFVLTADIDASETQYWDDADANSDGNLYNDPADITPTGNDEGWLPIGNITNQFRGHFDGKNYEITSLKIKRDDSTSPRVDALGLFGVLGNGAVIKNVNLDSAYYSYVGSDDDTPMGGIAGMAQAGSVFISNSNVNTSTINGKNNTGKIGGIIGSMQNSGGEISGCNVFGNVTGSEYVGGIVGYMNKNIDGVKACLVRGVVYSNSNYAGGIIGIIPAVGSGSPVVEITSNIVYASISTKADDSISDDYAGGIIGAINDTSVSISFFYNVVHSEEITAAYGVGGLIGAAENWTYTTSNFNYNIVSSSGAEISSAGTPSALVGFSPVGCSQSNSQNIAITGSVSNSGQCLAFSYISASEFPDRTKFYPYINQSIYDIYFGNEPKLESRYPYSKVNSEFLFGSGYHYIESIRGVDGTYGQNDTVTLTVEFSAPVTVLSGTPRIQLDLTSTGNRFADYVSGSGSDTLIFTYTVEAGDNSGDLDTQEDYSIEGGSNIVDTNSDEIYENTPLRSYGNTLAEISEIVIDTAVPTVTLTSSDSDNIINLTQTVSITATFNKDMQSSPTITIPGEGTFNMALTTASSTWYYDWDTTGVATGTYAISVAGTATNGESYAGTDTLSLDVQQRIYLDTNGVTIKCPTANVSETAVIGGKQYIVVDETALRTRENNGDDMTCVCTSKVTNMNELFRGNTTFNEDIGSWDTSNVTDTSHMFNAANAFNQDIGDWDVSSVTDMEGLFKQAFDFNQDIGSWVVSNVTTLEETFSAAYDFNQDISSWKTGNVTTLRAIFSGATAFNQDIGSWDTSNVTNFVQAFSTASSFNQNLSSWDTSRLTECFSMFEGASAYNNGGDDGIKNWDLSRVSDFSYMFDSASAFNQDIGDWDVSSVAAGNMDSMFSSATVFNQDLSEWCVTSITTTPTSFSTGSALTSANHPVWGECTSLANMYMYADGDLVIDYEEVITITASFSIDMAASPLLTVSGTSVVNAAMTQGSSPTLWTYIWNVSSSLSSGTYTATVAATDSLSRSVSSNASLTFVTETVPPTVTHALSQATLYLNSTDIVTYTATFSEPMTVTPTVDVNGQGYETLSMVSSDTIWSYYIDMSTYTGAQGALTVTVSGTDKFSNPYNAGSETLSVTVDTVLPNLVKATSSNTATTTYSVGQTFDIILVYDEAVYLTMGTSSPTFEIETNNTSAPVTYSDITYVSGSGSTSLTFEYTVKSGDNISGSAEVTMKNPDSINLYGGTLEDLAGNSARTALAGSGSPTLWGTGDPSALDTNATIKIDGVGAELNVVRSQITSTTVTSGTFKIGDVIKIQVEYANDGVGPVTGTPTLELDTNSCNSGAVDQVIEFSRITTITPGISLPVLEFDYIVQEGDCADDLNYTSINAFDLNGATIYDEYSNLLTDTTLAIAPPANGVNLSPNKIIVDGIRPQISNLQVTSSNASPAYAVLNDTVTLTFDVSETVTGVTADDIQFFYTNGAATSTLINADSVSMVGTSTVQAVYQLVSTDTTYSGGFVSWMINLGGFTDLIGNPAANNMGLPNDYSDFDGDNIIYDIEGPELNVVQINSDNAFNGAYAKDGNIITIDVVANENINLNTSSITIMGTNANQVILSPSNPAGQRTQWTIESFPVGAATPSGTVTFSINFADLLGNVTSEIVTTTTDSSSVEIDRAPQ